MDSDYYDRFVSQEFLPCRSLLYGRRKRDSATTSAGISSHSNLARCPTMEPQKGALSRKMTDQQSINVTLNYPLSIFLVLFEFSSYRIVIAFTFLLKPLFLFITNVYAILGLQETISFNMF